MEELGRKPQVSIAYKKAGAEIPEAKSAFRTIVGVLGIYVTVHATGIGQAADIVMLIAGTTYQKI